MAWLNANKIGKVQEPEVSSSSDKREGMSMITELIESEIESFALNICQSDHPVACECWPEIEKHLLHARDIYRALKNAKKLLRISEENPDDNQLWLYASSLERSTLDMCDYIDDIMKPLVGGLYHKGHIEMIF